METPGGGKIKIGSLALGDKETEGILRSARYPCLWLVLEDRGAVQLAQELAKSAFPLPWPANNHKTARLWPTFAVGLGKWHIRGACTRLEDLAGVLQQISQQTSSWPHSRVIVPR